MKTSVYCKTIAKGKQAFYLSAGGKEYSLFVQSYRVSNREFFGHGQVLDRALDTRGIHSYATLKTIEKLRPAIKYIEKEYGIAVLDGTLKKDNKKRAPYNRRKFMLASESLIAA